jgi:hypothetical protein
MDGEDRVSPASGGGSGGGGARGNGGTGSEAEWSGRDGKCVERNRELKGGGGSVWDSALAGVWSPCRRVVCFDFSTLGISLRRGPAPSGLHVTWRCCSAAR